MDIQVAFTCMPASSLAPTQDFFERLFGRPPDIVVHVSEVMWRLSDTAWLYVTVDGTRAGLTVATLSVGDLDSVLAELATRGIAPDRVETVGSAGRKAMLHDPDGNVVALAEVR